MAKTAEAAEDKRFRQVRQTSADHRSRGRLPKGLRIYAVGDIHGRVDLLDKVIRKIDTHTLANRCPQVLEVFLGDYVDRGPSSKDVVDRLLQRSQSHTTIFLKGNHEHYLCEFLATPSVLTDWERVGGLQTLLSYGLRPQINASEVQQRILAEEFASLLPETHKQFFGQLRLSFSFGGYFFAHAGVNPALPLGQQTERDLLWIRDTFLNYNDDLGRIIVHGHSPVIQPEVRVNRINIDTGAYATGRLTCLVLDNDHLEFL